MEKDDDGKETNVEVSRDQQPDPVLDITQWTPYPKAEGEESEPADEEKEMKPEEKI